MSGNYPKEMGQLENWLQINLKPISPRQEFINDLRLHLADPDPASLEETNFFKAIAFSLVSMLVLMIVVGTGLGVIRTLINRGSRLTKRGTR